MPLAGEGERAVQRTGEPAQLPRAGFLFPPTAQVVEKPRSGGHRPHRVGRGRADADLEDVEDAQEHGPHHIPGRGKGRAEIDVRPAGTDTCDRVVCAVLQGPRGSSDEKPEILPPIRHLNRLFAFSG
jgi:hypothetical protein